TAVDIPDPIADPATVLTPDPGRAALAGQLAIQADATVRHVRKLADGTYEIAWHRTGNRWWHQLFRRAMPPIRAKRVVIAAGCVGTNDLLMRCKAEGTIEGLSDEVGHHFSTNGDYIAFMEESQRHIGLTRGPVTTSYAHFNQADPAKQASFHMLE